MARKRTIELRQINISMHKPHSPQGYVDLFVKAYDLKHIVERGKADGYLLGELSGIEDAVERDELYGEIYRFTNIDLNAPWFNTETGKPAADSETKKISIPENLLPNLDRIPFIFRPKSHRFWFPSKDRKVTMGPSIAEKFLQQLFSTTTKRHKLPSVEVTTIPDEAAVDEVLRVHRITKLILEFKRPNADDASDVEEKIMKLMTKRKVDRWHEEMTSKADGGIVADDELKAQAKAAAHNGYVETKGYDATGKSVAESTKEKPARYVEVLNEKVETLRAVLSRVSSSTKSKGKAKS